MARSRPATGDDNGTTASTSVNFAGDGTFFAKQFVGADATGEILADCFLEQPRQHYLSARAIVPRSLTPPPVSAERSSIRRRPARC